jgi:hypothetical protein
MLLPHAATLTVVATDGGGNMNRTQFEGWRHYRAESKIQFASEEAPARAGEAVRMPGSNKPAVRLPAGAVIDLALDAGLDPAALKLGDVVTATLSRPLQPAENVLISQGAVAQGRVVRIEKKAMPFPIYEVGLQFDALAVGDGTIPLAATMQEAGPAAGLLHRSKHLDPTFTRRRGPHIDVLVPEIQRGQGILEWDARKGPIPRGLHMKWRVDDGSIADAARQ